MNSYRHRLALILFTVCLLSLSLAMLPIRVDVGEKVDKIMQAYSRERFIDKHQSFFDSPYFPDFLKPRRTITVESGYMISLPSGDVVRTGFLQTQAKPIIDLGPEAVPFLVNWVRSDNRSVRYIAIYSLEKITNVKTKIPRPGPGKDRSHQEKAIKEWMTWWKRR
jgi:hypothetical protein